MAHMVISTKRNNFTTILLEGVYRYFPVCAF
jgi:hypothetical protein